MTGRSWRGDGRPLRWTFKVTKLLVRERLPTCCMSLKGTVETRGLTHSVTLRLFHFRCAGVD